MSISRGSASGGALLARCLADRLGYGLLGREDVLHHAAKYGIAEEELQEALLKPPGFWGRFTHQRRRYLTFFRASLCEQAQRGRVVYHGNAGHLLLRGVSHVVCLRLIAPLEYRIRRVMERQEVTRDEAIRSIERVDHQRQQWTRFLYGVDWLDPSLYDAVVNLRTLDVEGAVEVTAALVQRPEFAPTEESRKAMADLTLASRVEAALAADPETASVEVRIHADGTSVNLGGAVRPESMVENVLRVAGAVKGVGEVRQKDLGAPDYTV